jgi:hypothetical protein
MAVSFFRPGQLPLGHGRRQLHLVMALAGGDHRVDVLGGVDDDVEEDEAVLHREGLAHGRLELVGLLDAHADVAEALGQLHEVRQRVDVGVGVAALVEELLPLAHHAHVAVVEQHTLTGRSYCLQVAISWMHIRMLASPEMQATWASGKASCTPMAAGRPKPMVPRPPELIQRRGLSNG